LNVSGKITLVSLKWNRIRYWTDQEVNKVVKGNSEDFLATIKTEKTS